VSDEAVWDAQRRLARDEGIFTEPAGAAALAGALQAASEGLVAPDSHVVCLVTGTGFKDEAGVARMLAGVESPMIELEELKKME
jgi:threonine synthase